MDEQGAVRYGTTTITYTVVRSRRRRKTVAITLDPAVGVLVTAPTITSAAQIDAIVGKRASWIMRQRLRQPAHGERRGFVSGESLPYCGQQLRLFVEQEPVRRPAVRLRQWSLHLTVPPGLTGEERRAASERAITRWYKDQAAVRLSERVTYWSARMGCVPSAVRIRDQRRRWGSCSPDGTLRFNWRIVMAPPALIDYVVVHELAHLRVRRHNAAFWAEVARLMPDYQLRRARLREIGPHLSL